MIEPRLDPLAGLRDGGDEVLDVIDQQVGGDLAPFVALHQGIDLVDERLKPKEWENMDWKGLGT
jgi:hypothetical protein